MVNGLEGFLLKVNIKTPNAPVVQKLLGEEK